MNKSCQYKITVKLWWLTITLLINVLSTWRWESSSISNNIVSELFLFHIFIINMKKENVSNNVHKITQALHFLLSQFWWDIVLGICKFCFPNHSHIGIDNILLLSFISVVMSLFIMFMSSLFFLNQFCQRFVCFLFHWTWKSHSFYVWEHRRLANN